MLTSLVLSSEVDLTVSLTAGAVSRSRLGRSKCLRLSAVGHTSLCVDVAEKCQSDPMKAIYQTLTIPTYVEIHPN